MTLTERLTAVRASARVVRAAERRAPAGGPAARLLAGNTIGLAGVATGSAGAGTWPL